MTLTPEMFDRLEESMFPTWSRTRWGIGRHHALARWSENHGIRSYAGFSFIQLFGTR